jgi:hypothetical protein
MAIPIMNKYVKLLLFGFLLWLIPFVAGFAFFDSNGNMTIAETFFKSIMIVLSGIIGVAFSVNYFKDIKEDYVNEGIVIGFTWFVISIVIDLMFVFNGFFQMGVGEYFTDIGMRYLSMPIYTIGMGWALANKAKGVKKK